MTAWSNRLNLSIWIEAEQWAPGKWTPIDDNSDVIVTLENGNSWIATFFSYKNIQSLAQRDRTTGDCLHGNYFWASDMILVDEVSRSRIEEVIEHLIEHSEFERVFSRCEET